MSTTNRAPEWLQYWPAVVVPVGVVGVLLLAIQNAVLASHVRELRTEVTALHQFVAQTSKAKKKGGSVPLELTSRPSKAGKRSGGLPGDAFAGTPPGMEEMREKARQAKAAKGDGARDGKAKGGKSKGGKAKAKAKAPPI